jgi:hypothetical protein
MSVKKSSPPATATITVSPASAARAQAAQTRQMEIARLDYENLKVDVAERLRFQVEFAHGTLKGLTLVNGGAIVALFTLIGAVPNAVEHSRAWWSFAAFAVGLVLVIVASCGAFFSQSFYMKSSVVQMWNEQHKMLGEARDEDYVSDYKRGELAEFGGIVAAFLSLGAFITGAGFALSGALAQ